MTDLPKLEDFPCQDYDRMRYDDVDALGHVSNVIFAAIMASGRAAILARPGIEAWTHKELTYVIARLEIDYRAELFWPGTVHVGTAVASIGNSSVVLSQALFHEGKCVATGRAVMVQVDAARHRPVPISAETRALLASLTLKSATP